MQLLLDAAPVSARLARSRLPALDIPCTPLCATQKQGQKNCAVAGKENLQLRFAALDVNSDQSVQTAFAAILIETGRIDVLVNNAGISNMGAVEETPIDVFRAVMETNFFGALRCMQAVLRRMREQRMGCIVNVSSVAGRFSSAPQAPYSSSKFALEALSECLAQEMKAFGVRVAIVEPGVIATPIFGNVSQPPTSTRYPQRRRLTELFRASLEKPVSPYVVEEKIRDIVDSGTWQLRHPVGPDAAGLLGLARVPDRRAMGGAEVGEESDTHNSARYVLYATNFTLCKLRLCTPVSRTASVVFEGIRRLWA